MSRIVVGYDGSACSVAALRWSLTKIRPLLDGARATRLCADRERVAFEAHGALVDLVELRALGPDIDAAPTPALEAAAARFRGPFLEGLELNGCHRFAAWCRGSSCPQQETQLSTPTASPQRNDIENFLRHLARILKTALFSIYCARIF